MVGEVANWCAANGLSIEKADAMWEIVKQLPPAQSPSDFVRHMEWAAKTPSEFLHPKAAE